MLGPRLPLYVEDLLGRRPTFELARVITNVCGGRKNGLSGRTLPISSLSTKKSQSEWETHCLRYLQMLNEGSCHGDGRRWLKPGLRPGGATRTKWLLMGRCYREGETSLGFSRSPTWRMVTLAPHPSVS